MTNFVELSDEEYAALSPIQKAHYKRAYNKHYGVVTVKKPRVTMKTLKDAIRDNCLDCVGSVAGVRECPVKKCKLYELRPYQ